MTVQFLEIPIEYTVVEDTNVDYVFKLTEVTLAKLSASDEDSFWGNVLADGGNIRLFSDALTENPLPLDLVFIDVALREIELWGRLDSPLLAVGGQSVYLELLLTGTPEQPDVSDVLGARAVWSDYVLVVHGVSNGNDTTNNYSFGVQSGPQPTFSRAGMNMPGARPRYDKRGTAQILSRNNFTASMELTITEIPQANINGIVLDRTGDGLPILQALTFITNRGQLRIAIQQDPPCNPPTPVTPNLRGTLFGQYGGIFRGFCQAMAGDLRDSVYRAEGEDYVFSGSYAVTDDPFSLLPFAGEFRMYRDGVQRGFNNSADGVDWSRTIWSDNSFFMGVENSNWTVKDLHIRNATLNPAYEAAQVVNRRDEVNFYGVPTVLAVPEPPPPPPEPPPPPPVSDIELQAW